MDRGEEERERRAEEKEEQEGGLGGGIKLKIAQNHQPSQNRVLQSHICRKQDI